MPRGTATARYRQHTLSQPAGVASRLALRLQCWLEARIAQASVLGDPMVYAPEQFAWSANLQAQWRQIRAELDDVLLHDAILPNFQDILEEVRSIQRDDQWKTFWLCGIGMDCRDNQRRCPETTRLLAGIPGLCTAFFSILAPGKHIPAHRGAYNGVLRLHLALRVPQDVQRCRIRIGDAIHHWQPGGLLIFDDSFQHEVWNDSSELRAVLFVDFQRPLRQPWRSFNSALIALGRFAPFLRRARARQLRWMRSQGSPG